MSRKKLFFSLLFVFSFLGFSSGFLFTETSSAQVVVKEHVFKFYLDPLLVPDMVFAKQVLPKYIADMNYILAKNTVRRLSFNPDTGIILTTRQPQSNSAGVLPVAGYEIWAHASSSAIPTYPYSYGGNMSFDQSGAAVLANLRWTRLYDPDQLVAGTDAMHDYWIQIDHMLHELAHVYGAGIGEYYNLAQSIDSTNTAPLLDINIHNANDSFWSDKQDFFTDPLLWLAYGNSRIGNPTSRSALLDTVKYAQLTATIMNGDYRSPGATPPMADMQHVQIRVVDSQTNIPLENAQVKIWNVRGFSPYASQLLVDNVTTTAGELVFAWNDGTDPHSNYDFLHLIKVYKEGYSPVAKYVSIFDADKVKLLQGLDTYTVIIPIRASSSTPTPTLSPTPPSGPDTISPDVVITSPENNAIVKRNSRVTIAANATDNVAIARVDFFVNDVLLCTDTKAAYTCSWGVPKTAGIFTIAAKAYDQSGNTKTTSITVTSK